MKVLQINSVYQTGSTGRIVRLIHEAARRKGLESYIGYGRGYWREEELFKIGSDIDFYIHAIGTRLLDRHGLFSKKATARFIEKIDRLRIDIFHLHNIHGYYLHYPTLFEYLKDKRVIWTLHDCWAFTGHCAYYEEIGCNKWEIECLNCPQKRNYPASFFIDNSQSNFYLKQKYFTSLKHLHIVVPSQWMKRQISKSFLKNFNVKIINNGIDLDIFRPLPNNFRDKYGLNDKFIILGVANVWEQRKGLHNFIKLAKKLRCDEIIVLIGLNENQITKLPSNILAIPHTNDTQTLVEIYSDTDIYLNLTLEDTFPTTNLESLACGTPVVTFDSGGSAETIDTKTGFVVAKNDMESVLDIIRKMKKTGKEPFRQACIQRAHTLYSQKNYELYIDLYKELIKI